MHDCLGSLLKIYLCASFQVSSVTFFCKLKVVTFAWANAISLHQCSRFDSKEGTDRKRIGKRLQLHNKADVQICNP